ncbi:MAG: hypothetical protein M3367_05995 [Acidobacteriota bacterium]|nr:hypothetical protein [Acidobacteriota bacterium]
MRRSLMVGVYIVVLSLAIAYAQALQSSFATKETNQAATSIWTADDIVLAEQAAGFQISPDSRFVGE